MESLAQKRTRVRKVITALRKAHPDARQALEFSNPLELLIALILAARARDDLVNAVTANLFKHYRTAADWANARPEQLHAQLRSINFYRNKTRAIQAACRALVERFNGQVPDKLEHLLPLPGVGRKTANFILGDAFGQPALGVDTHVARLTQRLGFTRKTDPDDIEADLGEIVPPKDAVNFSHLLQFHGRRVCLAARPACSECVVRKLCPFPKKAKA